MSDIHNAKNLNTATQAIERVTRISEEQFYKEYLLPKKPLVMTDMISHWGAMQKWSFDFFLQLQSEQEVHVEIGNVAQNTTDFRQENFSEFIARLSNDESEPNPHETKPNANQKERTAYLSVCDIFSEFPELKADIDFRLLTKHKIKNYVFCWIGPKGTVSGYHTDWADNILAQIYGRKRVCLVAPEQSRYMYPSSKYETGSILSSVDANHYDEKKYPLFQKATQMATVINPGEIIFIPRGWWHHVESLDKSISVNNFGLNLKEVLLYDVPRKVKNILHNYGLYGRECTCHMIQNGKKIGNPQTNIS